MLHDFSELIRGVQDRGFVFREQLLLGVSTEKLAQAIGEPIRLGAHSPVHTLTPKSQDEAGQNTYSGNYGLGMFPLHTDMANWHAPPRYLMLRCLVGAEDVATVVVDPRPIIDRIGIENLARALVKPRRRVAGRMWLLPLAERRDEDAMIRWDERYLQPASRAGAFYTAQIRERLLTVAICSIFLAKQGDTVVIDNWRMLHGRAAVPEGSRSRRIERVYLTALKQ
jgi:L-asparagine oxygenase